MSTAPILHSIGHSNHPIETFIGLLISHQIETVIDVRSWPSSRRLPHFNREPLRNSLEAAGITYLWFGKELGGKTDRNKNSDGFRARIRELSALAETTRPAIMCAEENPLSCHRTQLLGQPLIAAGVALLHIRGDGSLVADEALKDGQLSLFDAD
jgi:uncharacterized protein (DUF488 family)